MPAEWEPQSGVMLTWPHADSDWAATLSAVEPVFYTIAFEIALRETVLIICASVSQSDRVRATLIESGAPAANIVTTVVASNDTWIRDYGPVSVLVQGQPRLLDFTFNGWGNKYPAQLDNDINGQLARQGKFGNRPCGTIELVLEGGSIDSDGAGTLLTTASCQLHSNRNPGISRNQLNTELRGLLGAERLLWLEHGGLEGDDTDGHIDMLARFCDTTTIAYQACDEPDYGWHNELQAMAQELRNFTTRDGDPYRLVALPWPKPKFNDDGKRLPASYANFLMINDAVLVPAYDDPADGRAVQLLQTCFPMRTVVQIPCLPLIRQFGSLHCLTMQLPRGVLNCTPELV
ncbi:MAG: agmatine deiminase family protein [Gammaproteobacteria bacterium]|nr:MAG: agmatine deiminase family protein [Gammaproteobacteria bacterium]